jgi:hypothetical protein
MLNRYVKVLRQPSHSISKTAALIWIKPCLLRRSPIVPGFQFLSRSPSGKIVSVQQAAAASFPRDETLVIASLLAFIGGYIEAYRSRSATGSSRLGLI